MRSIILNKTVKKSGNDVLIHIVFFSPFIFVFQDIAANCYPQTPDQMDIPESVLSDQLEITSSDLTDSSSCTEDELSVCEMVIIGFITLQKGGEMHTGETVKVAHIKY